MTNVHHFRRLTAKQLSEPLTNHRKTDTTKQIKP
jgi:hypothetical protein